MHESVRESHKSGKVDDDLNPSHIVGIGASAGGLEALETLFKFMPPDSGVAIVVIQHLSPDHKSLMAELLSKRTSMQVHRVEDGMRVERNCVYLIPPNRNLRLFHGRLLLSEQDRDSRGINLPIDIFFRSLAEDQGAKAIAIVLSGTGSDGSSGIRAVKEELGMVMVQTEESAAFDGMPRSALATGLVDFTLPPEEMPDQLLSYLRHPYVSKDAASEPVLNDDDGLSRIFALLREHTKIDFTFYKPSTIVRRIERRMAVNQINELGDYVHFLDSYTAELNSLHKDLLIGVTNFFRDPEAFQNLEHNHLPTLLREANGSSLRLWVAGCSTGEEAYSIAILCREVMELASLHCAVKIFATDVDRDAILEASNGVFAASAIADIEPRLLTKYFYHKDEGFQISRQIREMVVFAQHNLVKDPPFTNIDLISCRNLLIYLQPVLQRRVLELFNFSLNAQGILMLGSSETTGEMSDYFEPLDLKWRIYHSRGRRRKAELSEPAATFDPSRWRSAMRPSARNPIRQAHEEERLLERLMEGISGDYLPFCMVVSETMELLQVVGDASPYLRFPTGKVMNDIVKLSHNDLAIPLSTGLQKVLKSREELIYTNIHLRQEVGSRVVNMRLKPLPTKKTQVALIAVFIELERKETVAERSKPETYDIGREAEQRITDLENELQFTRENLQATVEELETSNEELQATNEELLASNEELQSTNEELQSVNEELYTVNAEYQGKITELTEVNNDLDNLLSNSGVAALFIDENLDLRRFTPETGRLLQLVDQDLGRPLSRLKSDHLDQDLFTLAKLVQDTSEPLAKELRTNGGEQYLLRIYPYMIAPEAYSGIVMNFVNISGLRQAESALNERSLRMETLLDVIPDGYALIEETGRILEVNPALTALLGYSRDELLSQNIDKLMPETPSGQHEAYIRHYLKTGEAQIIGRSRHVEARHKEGHLIPIELSVAAMDIGTKHYFVGLMRPSPTSHADANG
jgi:two-component system, chemotaxis family, CheB/CheR fusion protein